MAIARCFGAVSLAKLSELVPAIANLRCIKATGGANVAQSQRKIAANSEFGA